MDTRHDTLALARHYVTVNQPQRALDALARLSPEAEDVEAQRLRGWAMFALEDFDGAARVVRGGLDQAPDSPDLLNLLALSEGQLGRLGEAERAILSGIRLDPHDPDLLCTYAQLLGRAGQLTKAKKVALEAARLDPDDDRVLQVRMGLAYLAGDDGQAERLGRELLAVAPENAAGHRMVGASLLERGNVGQASAHMDTAARQDVRDHEAASVAGEVRAESHPLLWPLWPFRAMGPIGAWLAAIVIVGVLAAAGFELLSGIFLLSYIALCVYSWVAPPLLRAWIRRSAPGAIPAG